jgi:hypothetical protein
MSSARILDREEYIEQSYFFRTLRERLAEGMPTQDVLERVDQEILSTTRLPYAIQFLATEVKHTGLLSTGFARLGHYFTRFQTYVVENTEMENRRFNIDAGLLVLEREAEYRAGQVSAAGLFVYQLEVISRNRLGYDDGLKSMAEDPVYDDNWRPFIEVVRRQLGLIELSDLIYLRSAWYIAEQKRDSADYQPPLPPLFGEKEGKIARAGRGRDPLYLFAALQRQLGYPVVPRPRLRDDPSVKIEALQLKLRDMEMRLKLLEAEVRGQVDLMEFGKPELLQEDEAG